MNRVLLNYLIKGFLINFLIITAGFYCFGVILNLLEEIEFFKNTNVSFMVPLMLTSIFIPSMIIKLLPFIIFISSMLFMMKVRNSKELLTFMKSVVSELNQTIVMVTHDPYAASFAERVIMLKDGEVASDMEEPTQEEIISRVTSLSDI